MASRAPSSGEVSPAPAGTQRVHRARGADVGFTMPELVVACTIIAILTALAIPIALNYLNSANAYQGARDVRYRLNQARMLAVSGRQPICVQFTATGYQFHQSTCAGAVVATTDTGPGGVIGYAEPVTVTGTSPVFSQFGYATTTSVLTVTSQAGRTTTVTVGLAGRVTIP